MAKYERALTGDFRELLNLIQEGILRGSISASLEDGSDFNQDGVQIAVRVFERYSWIGSNRVSLSVTLVGHGNQLFLSAITSGGSQAVFFKINRFGEDAFLDKLRQIVEQY
ncbi:MAG: hypothetical protein GX916_11455 [Clostridiales bacterium]|jgi:hypothetical protein|nr:hypothetical protein [Clostridiales bacterium]